jgi:hypothetical protein
MRHRVTITVNGKRRRIIRVAVREPIPNLHILDLDFGRSGPLVFAGRRDYWNGEYRMHASNSVWESPGMYEARALVIFYSDGTRARLPLQDTIIVNVPEIPKTPEHLPAFVVR